MLKGSLDKWQIIKTKGIIISDFWDIKYFNDKLYVSSISAIYELCDNKLVKVNFGKNKPTTCYRLTEVEGILWSIGENSIVSFDGKNRKGGNKINSLKTTISN